LNPAKIQPFLSQGENPVLNDIFWLDLAGFWLDSKIVRGRVDTYRKIYFFKGIIITSLKILGL